MPKSKVRSVVSVEVDEVDELNNIPALAEPEESVSWREEREAVARKVKIPSDLGQWWELLFGVSLVLIGVTLFRSWSVLGTQIDILITLVMAAIAIGMAGISGEYSEKESKARLVCGWLAWSFGTFCALIAIVKGPLPSSLWFLLPGLFFSILGWGIRRLTGESWLRILSLSLIGIAPILFVRDGIMEGIREYVNQVAFWYAGIISDMQRIPSAPLENGIEFIHGIVNNAAAFDNYAGILVAMMLSWSISVLTRQTFVVALVSMVLAYVWWMAFRGFACSQLGALSTPQEFADTISVNAMSFFKLLLLIAAIAFTSLGLANLLATIPVSSNSYELSPITVLYNAAISFPQLGPTSLAMVREESGAAFNNVNSEAIQSVESDDD
jgi:hypothetical protein